MYPVYFSNVGETQHATLMQDDRTNNSWGGIRWFPIGEPHCTSHKGDGGSPPTYFLNTGLSGAFWITKNYGVLVEREVQTEESEDPSPQAVIRRRRRRGWPRVSRTVPSVCPDWNAGLVGWRESSRRWLSSGLMCGKQWMQIVLPQEAVQCSQGNRSAAENTVSVWSLH